MPPRLFAPFVVTIATSFSLISFFPTPSNGSRQQNPKGSGRIGESLYSYVEKLSADLSSKCADAVLSIPNSTTGLYLDALGKPQSAIRMGNVDWLGSYSECTKVISDAHYCLAYLNIPNVTTSPQFPIRWGICVPKDCSEKDITEILQALFKDLRNTIGIDVELFPQPVNPFESDPDRKPVFCAKSSEYTTGVIVTLALCGFILFLSLVGTVVDVTVGFFKPGTDSVNKTDGFMPVRDSSIASDEPDRFPYFASDRGEQEDLIHSYPRGNSLPSVSKSKEKPNVLVQFFLCFSLKQNTNRILDTDVPAGAITSINGMRVLSMWWVILGHTYSIQIITGLSNLSLIVQILQRFTFLTVNNATFSVDSFFFLSGLLVSYLALRQMDKNKGRLPLFKFYFHRFWRLTPTYMFVVLFFDKLTGFLGEGPFWYGLQGNPTCDKYWWTNLLYINNFYPTKFENSCLLWAWYLANDMQFYIISPIILYLAYRFRIWGILSVSCFLLCGSFITTAVLFYHFDLVINLYGNPPAPNGDQADFNSLVYEKPYCRIAPYLVGMLLGYVFHTKIGRMPKLKMYVFNVLGWCIAIVLALSTLYGVYQIVRKDDPKPFNRAENIIYGTFSRFAWSLALAWVIFACHRGYGGLVNNILSARFWIPLSRLTYCAYLVHPIVIITLYGSYETVRAYSDVHVAIEFAGLVTMSYVVAFVVSVCVEYPMMQLEKLIFKTTR